MKRYLLINFAVLIMISLSCKKSTEESYPAVKADYYQLKVGNYWIYQSVRIDSAGHDTTFLPHLDSAYIEKDTLIRGYTFFKLYSDPSGLFGGNELSLLRDSSGYLINWYGKILCSDDNFTQVIAYDTLMPTAYMGYVSMTGRDSIINVPAGPIQSITSRMKVVPAPRYPQIPVRYVYSSYGKGIGMIKTHNFYFMGNIKFEGWLVRYKLK
ncbi:MAG: hypothetical protein WCO02_16955 [Bacteroidota bacterium]